MKRLWVGWRSVAVGLSAICAGTAQDAADAARLLAPRTAYRTLEDASATLTYVLSEPPEKIGIEILDADGATVARLHPDTVLPGLNKLEWDLRYEPPRLVALRTTPRENPHIWDEPRFQGAEMRPVIHKNTAEAERGPIAAPGRYTVRLLVDERTYTQPLEIALPPNSHGTAAEVQSSVRLQLRMRDVISAVADITNQIEWMRKQLEEQRRQAAGEAIEAMDQKLRAVELQLITHAEALSDEQSDAETPQLYYNCLLLKAAMGAGAGKYGGGGDYAPTETSIGLVRDLEDQLKAVRVQFNKLIDEDVAVYNGAAASRGWKKLTALGGKVAAATI